MPPSPEKRTFWSIITAPFRWIGRQLQSLWAKITGSSKAAPISKEPVAPKPLPNPPVQEAPPIIPSYQRAHRTPGELKAGRLLNEIDKLENRLKKLEENVDIKLDREKLKKMRKEIEGLEGRYSAEEQYISAFEKFISQFESELVQLEKTSLSDKAPKVEDEQAEYTQEKMLQELLDFCADQKIEGATEINSSQISLAEKVTKLKKLSVGAIMNRQESLPDTYVEEYRKNLDLIKLNDEINLKTVPCWQKVTTEETSKAGTPDEKFLTDLKAAVPMVNKLESELKAKRAQAEKTTAPVTKAPAPTSPPPPEAREESVAQPAQAKATSFSELNKSKKPEDIYKDLVFEIMTLKHSGIYNFNIVQNHPLDKFQQATDLNNEVFCFQNEILGAELADAFGFEWTLNPSISPKYPNWTEEVFASKRKEMEEFIIKLRTQVEDLKSPTKTTLKR